LESLCTLDSEDEQLITFFYVFSVYPDHRSVLFVSSAVLVDCPKACTQRLTIQLRTVRRVTPHTMPVARTIATRQASEGEMVAVGLLAAVNLISTLCQLQRAQKFVITCYTMCLLLLPNEDPLQTNARFGVTSQTNRLNLDCLQEHLPRRR
jgi:hypothetical protein